MNVDAQITVAVAWKKQNATQADNKIAFKQEMLLFS